MDTAKMSQGIGAYQEAGFGLKRLSLACTVQEHGHRNAFQVRIHGAAGVEAEGLSRRAAGESSP
jgi:hypothetical protein